jgi:hypothetical protein
VRAKRRISAAALAVGLLLVAVTFVPLRVLPATLAAGEQDAVVWRWGTAAADGDALAWLAALAPAAGGALCVAAAFLPGAFRGVMLLAAGLLLWLYEPLMVDLRIVSTYHTPMVRFYLLPLLPVGVFLTAGGHGSRWRPAAGAAALLTLGGYILWLVAAAAGEGVLWRYLAPTDEMVFFGKTMIEPHDWVKTLTAVWYLLLAAACVGAGVVNLWLGRRRLAAFGAACGIGAAALLGGWMLALGRASFSGRTYDGLVGVLESRAWETDHLAGVGGLLGEVVPQLVAIALLIVGSATLARPRRSRRPGAAEP